MKKILVVTTRTTFQRDFGERMRKRLNLGPAVRLRLLTVYPPRRRLPGIGGILTVDPSVLPWRPVVPVFGRGAEDWGGPSSHYVRVLRRARQLFAAVPTPAPLRATPQTMLAVACRTSRGLHARVADFDVIVALDADAALGVWWLAQRVPGPVMAYRPESVRKLLAMRGAPLPEPRPAADTSTDGKGQAAVVDDPPQPSSPPPVRANLLIAPANYAGQARAWAQAVRSHVPDATAMNLRAGLLPRPFPTDCTVYSTTFAGDLEWRLRWRRRVMETFTHVIVEANLPVLGASYGTAADNVRDLRRAGLQVAMLSHGSDARIPSVHAANEEWHPYDAIDVRTLQTFEQRARINVAAYNSFDGPVFVSTLGLVEFIPQGRWLPNIVDIQMWHRDEEPMERRVPVVAHVPSGPQKGSHMIDPILKAMAAQGVIEYRRIQNLRFNQMPEVYGTADIVVEQFGIADYSAAACEAMAAGRVVVSRVADRVRDRVREQTGLELPIVEANPNTLEKVITDLIHDPGHAQRIAARGREFARAVHDGRRSAEVLGAWLQGPPG